MYTGETIQLRPVFQQIADKLNVGLSLTRDEIEYLLKISDRDTRDQLFALARKTRNQHFGNRIFLYGFLYFSTYCRNNCQFCNYRAANTTLSRYRKSPKEILAVATEMADSGVHLIDLTMGEDPELYIEESDSYNDLLQTIAAVQKSTGLPVMISPGALSDKTLTQMAQVGASWFACYQETHNEQHFNYLRRGQDYSSRLAKKLHARSAGMLIEEGILLGTGETIQDLTSSLLWMKENAVDQVRAMTFVAPEDSPIEKAASSTIVPEQIVIAVMRLLMPDSLIPASLDVDGLDGLASRLNAGANVITSIVPPDKGLAGVANLSLDIEDNKRTRNQIEPILKDCQLRAASASGYKKWIENRQKFHLDRKRSMETSF